MAVKAKAKSAAKAKEAPAPRESISSLRGRLRRTEMLIKLSQRVAVIDSLDDLLATLVEIIANETNATPTLTSAKSAVAKGTTLATAR